MPHVGPLRAPLALLASLLFAAASGCSGAGDGSIAVQLVYPAPPGAAAPASAAVRAPSYAADPGDRIRIRVLAPHFAPIEKWFRRSDGRGEIGGIPPGARIAVEVDEYDNTAIPSGDPVLAAPLLGRGWYHGITLSPGEVRTVPVAMHAKGTIVTVCGAPAAGGSGTPGDNTADGILAAGAYLGNPAAVKAGPDDAIYVSSSAYRKVKRIDRYGYLTGFAGDGTHGAIVPGTSSASAPIGAVQDIDVDPAGNLYLFNDWNQIVRVDNGVVNGLAYDNGIYNSTARFDLAVVNVDLLYFVNYLENRVYRAIGTSKSDFVTDGLPYDATEPFSRFNYPLRAPSSIAYAPMSDSLVFADTDNDRIMRLSLADLNLYYLVADPGGARFSEGVDPLAMAPSRPRVVDYNPITGKIFFVEAGLNTSRVLYVDALGKVRVLAGVGTLGFSGDGGPATSAQLSDPRAVTVDSRGNAYIADYGNHAVRMVVGGALP